MELKKVKMRYKVCIEIDAPNEPQANELVQALVQIKNSLSDKDLLDLARLLKEKPGIVKTAKKFLG